MGLIAWSLGRLMPKHRTLAAWAIEYRKLLDARPLKRKTRDDRNLHLQKLLDGLGHSTRLCQVRPSHIARLIRDVHRNSPNSSRRTLSEAQAFFDAAIVEGWIDTNPADPIKRLPAPVQRKRLALEEWSAVYAWSRSEKCPATWIAHMLLLALVTGQRRADLQKMRFEDVQDGYLYIEQQKTGTRIALPTALRLEAIGISLADVIEGCRDYAAPGPTMLRKKRGGALCTGSLSSAFRQAFVGAYGRGWTRAGTPPSLHECRSLAERLYRDQGIDTQTLLGHAKQQMTDEYNDDRGLSKGQWKRLTLPDKLRG